LLCFRDGGDIAYRTYRQTRNEKLRHSLHIVSDPDAPGARSGGQSKQSRPSDSGGKIHRPLPELRRGRLPDGLIAIAFDRRRLLEAYSRAARIERDVSGVCREGEGARE